MRFRKKRKAKFMLFSRHKRSLLGRQPGYGPKGAVF